MKKILIVLLLSLVAGLAFNVQADEIPFDPIAGLEPPPIPDLPPPPPPDQAPCVAPPDITVNIMPVNIWAPTGKEVDIEISGTVSVADGCAVSAIYRLESDEGPIQGELALDAAGEFLQTVTVNLSKDGKDLEGTTYHGVIFANDEGGNASELNFYVTVLHDKGGKIGLNK